MGSIIHVRNPDERNIFRERVIMVIGEMRWIRGVDMNGNASVSEKRYINFANLRVICMIVVN